MLEQIARRDSGASIPEDIQTPSGCNPEQSAVMDATLSREGGQDNLHRPFQHQPFCGSVTLNEDAKQILKSPEKNCSLT